MFSLHFAQMQSVNRVYSPHLKQIAIHPRRFKKYIMKLLINLFIRFKVYKYKSYIINKLSICFSRLYKFI
jgi:hypothetical protein